MSSQAQLQSQIAAIDNALQVLRPQLASAQPGSTEQTQLSIAVFRLEQDRASVETQLANITVATNPPNPQIPLPAQPIPPSKVIAQPEVINENNFVFNENDELVPADSAEAEEIRATNVRNAQAQDENAESQSATLDAARAQAALNERRKQANQSDWRVRLRLAPSARYLYKAENPGILHELAVTDGVIFPYTPKIDLSYRAMYDITGLTHTNYNNYFYKNSTLDPVNITATFTAQDTAEANYLLAVIHFFRSVTKMFYGNDAQRGAPPPLVFFTGLGEYQFSEHPCVIHQFNYSLPSDVDYIRARSVMDPGTDLQVRRNRKRLPSNNIDFALERLKTIGIGGPVNGGVPPQPSPATLGTNSPTYVPTRIDISLILYPIQSRAQVTNEFSLKQYANGDLLKGGFW